MSDFSYTATCPGCHSRFAPDDGECCSECVDCGIWGDHVIELSDGYVCKECFEDAARAEARYEYQQAIKRYGEENVELTNWEDCDHDGTVWVTLSCKVKVM